MQFSSSGGGNSDLDWLNQLGPERGSSSGSSGPDKDPNRNRRLGIIIAICALLVLCGGVFGLALYRARDILNPAVETTITPSAGVQATCRELIDRAMQASGNSCDQMGSNEVCYGNNTLTAELNSPSSTQFAQVGDVVSVTDLRRLAASPLRLASQEWGIAVFKVIANLPRSLPGETITMVVFGNTTLDNPSNNLQTFYFSSTLGQIDCDQVPFDGLMITMPNGAGVSFVINGAEMTLMGDASIKATQNGSMDVSMYSGSAYISANGESQFVTAGQSTSMDLGGTNGTSAVSPPSAPEPLSPAELALACTMTGHFCSQQEITPVSPQDALNSLLTLLGVATPGGVTATSLPNSTSTVMPSLMAVPNLISTNTPLAQSFPSATLLFISTDTLVPLSSPTSPSLSTATSLPPATATNPPPPTATNPPPPTATNPPPPTTIPMISICHCSEPNKCNQINIPNVGSGGHWNHQYDIIPAPAGGCPVPPPDPSPTP
jgi:hypothetical protein